MSHQLTTPLKWNPSHYFSTPRLKIMNPVYSELVAINGNSLYPKGNMKRDVNGHISLYLAIADTKTLPLGWEVNVNFKLFVFDHIRDKYLAIQDFEGEIKRFHRMKTEWGFDKLLSLDSFIDASNGYLLDDCCVFGAEVFVINYYGKGESVSMLKDAVNNGYVWKISKFSAMDKEFLITWKINNFSANKKEDLSSEKVVFGENQWGFWFFPKRKMVSLYLLVSGWETLPSARRLSAEFKLRIRDQLNGNHFESQVLTESYSSSNTYAGRREFLPLNDLNDASKGFILNDAVILEADITLKS
ncbi:Ubiquitin carboxyl-terminal hydrolase 12 [Camellia lanceoleosa]|uniref:Ubiquitin carboxyl-terminal hydrolase 12 n=1 Tax=Camellia lanceoleosa TaxID=1840588 RepID=A0ACC0IT84_9ERIC|nr:Ubiquitin carboxyl-terminal hydrolase 12 [Camellia lanceoleosa]